MTLPSDANFKLPDIGTTISISIAASFVLSVVFDYGFFAALGSDPFTVPMTLADHTQSALFWLPSAALTLILSEVLLSHLHRTRERARTLGPKAVGKTIATYVIVLSVLTAALIVVLFFVGDAWWLLASAFALGVWTYAGVRLPRPGESAPRFAAAIAVRFLVPIAVTIFLLGYLNALQQMAFPGTTAQLKLNANTAQRQVNVVRVIERGVLYLDGDFVSFVDWNEVGSMRSTMVTHRFRNLGILCRIRRCSAELSRPANHQ